MAKKPIIQEFKVDSLEALAYRITAGDIPSRRELDRLRRRLAQGNIPVSLAKLLAADATGRTLRRRGRKANSEWLANDLEILRYQRDRYAAWLKKRKARHGLVGWSAIRHQEWWQGAPKERALLMAHQYMKRKMGAFLMVAPRHLNNLLSEKSRG